jgi:hypothetical protein
MAKAPPTQSKEENKKVIDIDKIFNMSVSISLKNFISVVVFIMVAMYFVMKGLFEFGYFELSSQKIMVKEIFQEKPKENSHIK